MNKTIKILGTRGIPAQHGGFETFVEHLAPYLVNRGWKVIVYCQEEGSGDIYEDKWNGVDLVHIPVSQPGAKGTVVFDWKSTLHAAKTKDLILTLGYNTAIFCILYRLKGIHNIINMDGIEWKRDKWTALERVWLYINERAGCWLGNHLVADNPEIKKHLATRVKERNITMIPYGADTIESADVDVPGRYGLEPGKYVIVIARPEPENSILEIVNAFSAHKRGIKLAMVGNYDAEKSEYQKAVIDAASDEVCFLGAIYEKPNIQSLRYYASLYVHGHTVGGTNPSLVEALGAATPVLAHDNRFNRWVIGEDGSYFKDQNECEKAFDDLLNKPETLEKMKKYSKERHQEVFTWDRILAEYESMLNSYS